MKEQMKTTVLSIEMLVLLNQISEKCKAQADDVELPIISDCYGKCANGCSGSCSEDCEYNCSYSCIGGHIND